MTAYITDEQIKADILHKLHRKKKWGGAHTAFEHLYKHCDKQYWGRYKEIADSMIKEGFLILKPTQYGLQVSLNPSMHKKIVEIVSKFLGIEI